MHTKQVPSETPHGLLAAREVCQLTGVSRAHWHSMVKEGRAPSPALRWGTRFTRWRASDVQKWLADPQAWLDANVSLICRPMSEQPIVRGAM